MTEITERPTGDSNRKAQMAFFTVLMEYRGGTYVSQVRAASVSAAVRRWAAQLDPNVVFGFGPAAKRELVNSMIDNEPAPLTGLTNVWCCTALVRGKLAHIDVVRTER